MDKKKIANLTSKEDPFTFRTRYSKLDNYNYEIQACGSLDSSHEYSDKWYLCKMGLIKAVNIRQCMF